MGQLKDCDRCWKYSSPAVRRGEYTSPSPQVLGLLWIRACGEGAGRREGLAHRRLIWVSYHQGNRVCQPCPHTLTGSSLTLDWKFQYNAPSLKIQIDRPFVSQSPSASPVPWPSLACVRLARVSPNPCTRFLDLQLCLTLQIKWRPSSPGPRLLYLFIVLCGAHPLKLYITKACGSGLRFSRMGATGGVWERSKSGAREGWWLQKCFSVL